MKRKFQELFEKYGPVAVALYFSIFFLVWGGFALAMVLGFRPDSVAGGAGVATASYLATKVTQPLRIGATLVLTPAVAKVWERVRGGRPTPPAA